MKPYPKIDSVYRRDPETDYRTFTNEYSRPEFEYLADAEWTWREKIHGTNIRVIWDPREEAELGPGTAGHRPFLIKGRKEKSQVPDFLADAILRRLDPVRFEDQFGEDLVCLYGEGYGAKIQDVGERYIPDGHGLCLFDVLVGDWWLREEDVTEIAENLGLSRAPVLSTGTLEEAEEIVRAGFLSVVAAGDVTAEGLVLLPETRLRDRAGRRIITKLKHADFRG